MLWPAAARSRAVVCASIDLGSRNRAAEGTKSRRPDARQPPHESHMICIWPPRRLSELG